MRSLQDEGRLFFGYRLQTNLPLTSLPSQRWEGPPDITLLQGDVPAHLADVSWSSPFIEIGEDGAVLVRAGDRIRFLIRDGRQVTVSEASTSLMGEIETFLFGVVAGIVIHQRGDLALHASSVVVDGGAVAIVGPSGRGKSTLAAALAERGHMPLSDDVCRIKFAETSISREGAWVIPGSSKLRLWPDAAAALACAPDLLSPGRPGHPKRLLAFPFPAPAPVALAAVIRLGINSLLCSPCLERLRGPGAVMPADDILYRPRLGRRLGRRIGLFQDLMRLATLVPVYSLSRTGNPADIADLTSLVVSATRNAQ